MIFIVLSEHASSIQSSHPLAMEEGKVIDNRLDLLRKSLSWALSLSLWCSLLYVVLSTLHRCAPRSSICLQSSELCKRSIINPYTLGHRKRRASKAV
jgi:hypothetical protein